VINGLFWLLGCQVLGEIGVRVLHLSIPGPVLGMAVLFVVLSWRRPPASSSVFRAGDGLIKHLQLLFIPAGVGVITMFHQIGHAPLPLLGGLLVSWVAGLVVVGWLVTWVLRMSDRSSR
jgi:holin-like protein